MENIKYHSRNPMLVVYCLDLLFLQNCYMHPLSRHFTSNSLSR